MTGTHGLPLTTAVRCHSAATFAVIPAADVMNDLGESHTTGTQHVISTAQLAARLLPPSPPIATDCSLLLSGAQCPLFTAPLLCQLQLQVDVVGACQNCCPALPWPACGAAAAAAAAAMALDLASPLIPGGFMVMASLGSVARAMVRRHCLAVLNYLRHLRLDVFVRVPATEC
jgi:hypothetical protein